MRGNTKCFLCVKLLLRQEGDVLRELQRKGWPWAYTFGNSPSVKTSLSELTIGEHTKGGPRAKLQRAAAF